MIRSRLKEIVDEKGLSIRKVAVDSELHFEPVRRMYNDTMERYPRDMLDKLCALFDIEVGELLEYVREKPTETGK